MSGQGHQSSIYENNASIAHRFSGLTGKIGKLVFDPQTSGGLLAAIAADQADDVLAGLIEDGYDAAIIGKITDDVGNVDCV